MKLNKNLVCIEVDEPEETTENGVYIQEEWKSQNPTGRVVAVGSGVTFCKPEDRVFFERYTAIQTPFGKNTRICREDAILAIYE